MDTEANRQKLVGSMVAFTKSTSLAAGEYERYLLEQYAQQNLTIDEVTALLSAYINRYRRRPLL